MKNGLHGRYVSSEKDLNHKFHSLAEKINPYAPPKKGTKDFIQDGEKKIKLVYDGISWTYKCAFMVDCDASNDPKLRKQAEEISAVIGKIFSERSMEAGLGNHVLSIMPTYKGFPLAPVVVSPQEFTEAIFEVLDDLPMLLMSDEEGEKFTLRYRVGKFYSSSELLLTKPGGKAIARVYCEFGRVSRKILAEAHYDPGWFS